MHTWSWLRQSAILSLLIGAFAILMGCQESGRTKPKVETTTAALNANPAITDFAVYAHNSATLRDRVQVSSGDVGVRMAGTGTFLVSGYELALASDALVDVSRNVIANRVLLQDRARVGDVQANQLTNQFGYYVHRYSFPGAMPALPSLAPVSPGTTAVTVAISTTVSLPAGSYGAITVQYRGVLRLPGGVYHVASLQLDDEARIEAFAPVHIRVAGRINTLAHAWIGAAGGVALSAGDLRVEVSGRNGNSGSISDWPKAAVFSNDSTIHGVMLVPNGTLLTGHRMEMVGAYAARDVYVDIDSQVYYQSGVGPAGCLESCDDGNPCTTDACSVGACVHTPAAPGTTCADANACNGSETCDGTGQCLPGTPVTCTALDQCHAIGECNPATGICSNPTQADGASCDDGDTCTKDDACAAGACGGTAYTCDDGLPCTSDTCNGDGTCTFLPNTGSCVIADTCYAPEETNPANLCEQCSPGENQTAWSARPAGTTCNDGNACTKNDVCTAGVCGGTTYACDDGLACTSDTCNGDGTCTFPPNAGSCVIAGACHAAGAANPGNPCEVCDPAQATQWSNQPEGMSCNDGNAQTQVDACTLGQCQGTVACASVATVSAGGEHTCALRDDGSLWCWGANWAGQLGSGSFSDSLIPQRAGAGTWNWETVTAGATHTCAIRRDDTLWCWGDNPFGQLGGGITDPTPTPMPVVGEGWTAVQAGDGFTCGTRSDGILSCWGRNTDGNLGNGTVDDSPVPVEVDGNTWVGIAVGAKHACGLKSDHSLWCWGGNSKGQLGTNSITSSSIPVQVGGTDVWTQVAAGATHTCGLHLDGGLWCWGDNHSGALGSGTSADSLVPVRVGSATWTQATAGSNFTCGVQVDGGLSCWGQNAYGQLGDGTLIGRLAPVRIPGVAWAQIATGQENACGKRQDGSLWCWGHNLQGEVGDGTSTAKTAPVQVVGELCSQVPICGNGTQEAGEECDDGNDVNGDGCSWHCESERCHGVVCTASDQCHDAGVCDPLSGECSNPTKADGTPCADGNTCTKDDTCTSGTCGGTAYACDDGLACTGDTCNGDGTCTFTPTADNCVIDGTCYATGVANPSNQCQECAAGTNQATWSPKANGAACNDGTACTQTDMCQDGACIGSEPVVCTASDQCHEVGTCDPGTGSCTNPAMADGTSCSDGNACTRTDTCQAGACMGGNPVVCTASDQCHSAGTCNPATGACSNPAVANGTTCNDGNGCTRTDTCQSGVCTGSAPVTCLPPDQCHLAGACAPATGTCSYPEAADGTACNDGSLCTQTDQCQSGVCAGSNPVVCTAGNQCQGDGICDKSSGFCLYPGKTNGTACDDGDASTETDTCQMGVCMGVPAMPSATVSTVVGDLGFLYQGSGASQVGVVSGTINAKRAAGVRGQAFAGDSSPLVGAKVTIADHPEYGYSSTTEDGSFAMIVNGGGRVTVRLTKDGYLMAERSAEVPWQGYAEVERMVLLPTSTVVSLVNPGQPGMQVAAGSPVTDGDGSRQAVLLFPSGTSASMTVNGTKVALGSLRVRITEVTVGEDGPAALPGPLPASSAYTYAVAYTVDEALASGDATVTFDRPIYHYSENFIGFPVGTKVPSAYYDASTHRWVPSTDGRVIEMLGVDGGQASLDVEGNGLPADAATLASLGFSSEELSTLAGRYAVGTMLWRVPLTHFSWWDYNWPWAPPVGASNPEAICSSPPQPGEPTITCGSIIENETQVVGERVPIAGTPFTLNYRSSRTPGYRARDELFLKLTGASVPEGLTEVLVRTNVAGQAYETAFAPAANLGYDLLWDGRDGFGRMVNGLVRPDVMVGFRYPLVYTPPPGNVDRHFATVSFGELSSNPLVETARGRKDAIAWQQVPTADVTLGRYDARGAGLGGWTVDVHHTLDKLNNMWLGDGSSRLEKLEGSKVIRSSASGAFPRNKITVGKDGTVYVAGYGDIAPRMGIYKVNADQTLSLFVDLHNLPPGMLCSGVRISALTTAPDGSIYFSAFPNWNEGWGCPSPAPPIYIFHLSPAGTLLGYWPVGTIRDFPPYGYHQGIPAAIQVAPDGTVYYLEMGHAGDESDVVPDCLRVIKLRSDGSKAVVAGKCGTRQRSQDPGPAVNASFDKVAINNGFAWMVDLAVGRDGSLYIANYSEYAVRKISPDGIITTFAGSTPPVNGVVHGGDGGPATQAVLAPVSVAVGPHDVVYIGDYSYNQAWGSSGARVRSVVRGTIQTVIGSNSTVAGPDGTPALQAGIYEAPYGLTIGPDGAVYVLDSTAWTYSGLGTLRRFGFPLPGLGEVAATVTSRDRSEIYLFDSQGRHTATRDALTNSLKYTFGYTPDGRLASITDANSLVTTIEQDGQSGQATAIVAPNGQRTELGVNADGYLESIDLPGGIHHGYSYNTGVGQGLLAAYQNPRGQTSSFTYDERGRVTSESMPGGCSWSIQRLSGPTPQSPLTPVKVSLTSAEGRTHSSQLGQDATNLENGVFVSPAGLQTLYTRSRSGVETTTTPEGMKTTVTQGADAQYGLQAPLDASTVVKTPAGKQMSVSAISSAALDGSKNLISRVDTTSVNGKGTTSTYDAVTRTRTTVSPAGRRTVTMLDAQGRVVQVQAGNLAPTSYSYDPRGRLETMTVGTGSEARVTSFGYDDLDRLTSVTDPLSRVQQYIYDDANRVVGQIFPDLKQVGFTYDPNGNVTSVTPPERPAHEFGFTPNDLMSSYTPPTVPGTGATTYEYNLDKQPTVIHRPDGTTINFTYDSAGRLATTTHPAGPSTSDGTITVTRTYNPTTGKLTSLSTSDGQNVSYGYDGSLLTSTTWSGTVAGTVSRTYNNDFRVASESVNGANTMTFGFDNDGLLTSADGLAITRDPINGLISDTALGGVTDHRTYDGFGQVATHEAKFGTTSLYSVVYVRDVFGRIETKTETIQGTTTAWGYGYDSAGRLWQVMKNGVVSATYLYDSNGNRLSKTTPGGIEAATYDDQDRMLTCGKWAYTYTANGELRTRTDTTSGALTKYSYDGSGNLRKVELPDGRVVEYVIDGSNRRVAKKINGVVVKRWLYEGKLLPVAEFDSGGALVARFGAGGVTRESTKYRIVADHLGNPRLVVNTSTGAIAQRFEQDEWGSVTANTAVGFTPFGFAAGLHDSDTALVHFGARDYDPSTGRWLTKDPIAFGGGQANLYVYSGNDPVNNTDPSGLNVPPPRVDELPVPAFGVCLGRAYFNAGAAPPRFPYAVPGEYSEELRNAEHYVFIRESIENGGFVEFLGGVAAAELALPYSVIKFWFGQFFEKTAYTPPTVDEWLSALQAYADAKYGYDERACPCDK